MLRLGVGRRQARQQLLRLELLAAEPHDEDFPAEVRVAREVLQRTNRHRGSRCIGGKTASVGMVETDHVVHVGVLRQQPLLDERHHVVDDAGHALHAGGDPKDVARADGSIGISKALERVPLERRLSGWHARGDGQAVQRRRRGQRHREFTDPRASAQRLDGVPDDLAVADHAIAFGDVDNRHLVPLRHSVHQHQAIVEDRSGGKAARVDDNRDVVAVVERDPQGLAGSAGRRVHARASRAPSCLKRSRRPLVPAWNTPRSLPTATMVAPMSM